MRRLLTSAVVLASALGAAGCGYRPAGAALEDGERAARVPAFVSVAGYPELDVYAGSYLASRLTAMGIRPTSDPTRAERTIQGRVLGVSETPVTLGAEQTLVELAVDVQIGVEDAAGGEPCQTGVARGRASMSVPLDTVSEGERQRALQLATSDAIDALLLETVLCARAGEPDEGG